MTIQGGQSWPSRKSSRSAYLRGARSAIAKRRPSRVAKRHSLTFFYRGECHAISRPSHWNRAHAQRSAPRFTRLLEREWKLGQWRNEWRHGEHGRNVRGYGRCPERRERGRYASKRLGG